MIPKTNFTYRENIGTYQDHCRSSISSFVRFFFIYIATIFYNLELRSVWRLVKSRACLWRFSALNVKDWDEPIGETDRNAEHETVLNTNERRNAEMNIILIAEHHRLRNHSPQKCITYSLTPFNDWLQKAVTSTYNEHLNRCKQLKAPYNRLIHDVNKTDERTLTSNRTVTNLTSNRLIETDKNWPITAYELPTSRNSQ